jgi:hypothetical protein
MHVRRSSRNHLIAPASVNLWIAHYLKHVFQRRLARRMSRCAGFGVCRALWPACPCSFTTATHAIDFSD